MHNTAVTFYAEPLWRGLIPDLPAELACPVCGSKSWLGVRLPGPEAFEAQRQRAWTPGTLICRKMGHSAPAEFMADLESRIQVEWEAWHAVEVASTRAWEQAEAARKKSEPEPDRSKHSAAEWAAIVAANAPRSKPVTDDYYLQGRDYSSDHQDYAWRLTAAQFALLSRFWHSLAGGLAAGSSEPGEDQAAIAAANALIRRTDEEPGGPQALPEADLRPSEIKAAWAARRVIEYALV